MKICQAKHAVLHDFYDNGNFCQNAISISQTTGLDVKTTYRCISSLLLGGYLRLSILCASDHSLKRSADYYEITPEGIAFIEEDESFCRKWRLPLPYGLELRRNFPFLITRPSLDPSQ